MNSVFGTVLAFYKTVPFGTIDRPSAEGVVTRASLFPDLEWWWCGLPCRPKPWSACRRGRARIAAIPTPTANSASITRRLFQAAVQEQNNASTDQIKVHYTVVSLVYCTTLYFILLDFHLNLV